MQINWQNSKLSPWLDYACLCLLKITLAKTLRQVKFTNKGYKAVTQILWQWLNFWDICLRIHFLMLTLARLIKSLPTENSTQKPFQLHWEKNKKSFYEILQTGVNLSLSQNSVLIWWLPQIELIYEVSKLVQMYTKKTCLALFLFFTCV